MATSHRDDALAPRVGGSRRTSGRQLGHWLASAGYANELRGSGDELLTDVAPLDAATATDLAYAESAQAAKTLGGSPLRCLLVARGDADAFAAALPRATLILVDDPQAAFIAAMLRFRPGRPQPAPKVAIDAYLAPTARVGEDCYIGANVYVGADCRIGDRCRILPGAYLGDGVHLGDDCVVHPNAVLYDGCRLGDRVILHANCVIGADGFGYRFEGDHFDRIPHTGRVVIESDCEIGACTTIDRGMIADTVIGAGTKLDNLVMVAHNCRIGSHTVAAAQVGIAGSARIGSFVQMGGNAGINGHCTIGDAASVGAKAAVVGDVPPKTTVHGVPAKPATEALRQLSAVKRLPEMRAQLRDLEARLAELEAAAGPHDSRRAA